MKLVPFISVVPFIGAIGLFLASLVLLTQLLKEARKGNLAQWLLDTSTLFTTITIAFIGWNLTIQQDKHNSEVM